MRIMVGGAVLAAVVAVLTGCADGRADGHTAPTTGEHTGISPGATILWHDDERLDADMAAIADTGAGWVRLDIDWASIEPTRGRFSWTATDRVMDAAQRHDVRVLAVLTYTPEWARPAGATTHAPPLDVADFAAFAAAAAERYGDIVAAWEVWNEPNIADFWEPLPDPATYARLLTATAEALRAADRDAFVLSGGLAPAETTPDGEGIDPVEFLAAVYAAGAGGSFDAVAVHPYSYPALPTQPGTERWNTFARLPLVHGVMVEHGHAEKPVWLTEVGSPTGTGEGAVTPQRQAEILTDGFAAARRWEFVGPLFVYSLRDTGSDLADREQNFGILDVDGRPKPAWHTLRRETSTPWPTR